MMDDVDKVIRRLDHWIKVWEYLDAEKVVKGKGIKYLQDAVTALLEIQKETKRLDAALGEVETEAIKPVVSADKILEIIEKARAVE